NYGFVADITDFTASSPYGLVTSFIEDGVEIENFLSNYGTVSSISETDNGLTVYYIRKPKEITSLEDELEIDSMFDTAIKYYVTGMALRDDLDTQNRTLGKEELDLYTRELGMALSSDLTDNTRATQYETK